MTLSRSLPVTLIALHLLFYAGFAGLRYGLVPILTIDALLLAILLIWISIVDVMRMEIPDFAAVLLALTGGGFAYLNGTLFWDHLVAGTMWPLLFWAVAGGYARFRGWQGLGFGDVKLMIGIGLWLGLSDTTLVVFASALAAIAFIVATKLVHRETFSQIGTSAVAFGPFLCLSAWVTWLF